MAMTPPSEQSTSTAGWHVIHDLHADRQAACVCVSKAIVIYNMRRATPYEIADCIVGFPTRIDDDGFVLSSVSGSFHTRVEWSAAREAWARTAAPDPCPHCGSGESR